MSVLRLNNDGRTLLKAVFILAFTLVMPGCNDAGHNDSYEPTEAEITAALNRALAYEHMVAATNALIFARATNVWRRIVAGEDFVSLARNFSEVEEGTNDGRWGEFPLSSFSGEPELKRILETMRVGEVSLPVEGDNGLLIVRLNGREGGNVDVDRIFFRLPEELEKIDRKTVVQRLKQEYDNRRNH